MHQQEDMVVTAEPHDNEIPFDYYDLLESLKPSLDTSTIEKLCEYFMMTSSLEEIRSSDNPRHHFLLVCRRNFIITREDTTKLLEAFRKIGLANPQQKIEVYNQILNCPNVRVTVNNDNSTSAFSRFKTWILLRKRAIQSFFYNLGIHFVDCKEGSLIICLKVSSVEQLDKLKEYIESGVLLNKLMDMYESKISYTERKDFQPDRSSIKICYDTEDFENANQQLTTKSFNSSKVRKMDNLAGSSSGNVRKMDNQAGSSSGKVRKMDNLAGGFETRMANSTCQRPLHPIRDYGIVLAGKTNSGKSSTGNTILGRTAFTAEPSGQSVTGVSSYATSEYGDRTITVVDTPGIHDNVRPDSVVKQEYARMAFLLREGVHCFVICMNASEVWLTTETKQFLDQVKVSGHADFFDYCMLVYTKPESELCDLSLNEYLEKQKENEDMKSFLENIGDRVLAVNNKARDPRERERNKDAIMLMVDKVIEGNIIKKKPIVFTNDTFENAKEMRKQVVSVVERISCHPSLVNAVIEAAIWFSNFGTIAEEEFVEKVITILCKSNQCKSNGTNLVFRNDEEDTTTPVVDCKTHIKMIYTEIKSNIGQFYKMMGTIRNYKKTYSLTTGVVTAGAGILAGATGIGAVGAILGLPAVIAYGIGSKMS